MNVATITGVLRLDDSDWQRSLASAASSINRFEGQVSATASRVNQSLNSINVEKLARVGTALTAGVTAPLLGMAAASVKAASGLEESMNKVNVVFGRNAAQVQSWARTQANAFGQTQQQALDAASGFAAILTSAGTAEGAVAGLSLSLTKLASDLASFHNIGTAEALEKLRSGIVGEREPLLTLGILLSEDAVKAEAARVGIAALGTELTEGQKVQARYSLILRQSQSAHGDFARTSDGLANTLRQMQAELGDAAAELGKEFIPAAKEGLKTVREWLHAWNGLSAGAKQAIITIAGVAAVAGPVLRTAAAVMQLAAAWRAVAAAQAIAGAAGAGAGAAGAAAGAAGAAAAGGAAGAGAAAVGVGALGVGVAGGLGAAALVGIWGGLGYLAGDQLWGGAAAERDPHLRAARASLARQNAGKNALNERRRLAGLAYFDADGRLHHPATPGAAGAGIGAGMAAESRADREKRERAALEGREARAEATLEGGLARAGMAGDAATEAQMAVPYLRQEQRRILGTLTGASRTSKAYWDGVREIWRLEVQANDLQRRAVQERRSFQQRAEEQARELQQARAGAIFQTGLDRAGVAVAGAAEGQQAATEAQAVIPVLRQEQARILGMMRAAGPGQKEYWEGAREVWRLEQQAAKLTADATREREQNRQRAEEEQRRSLREQQRALEGVRDAAQRDRSLAERGQGLRDARIASNPFLDPRRRLVAQQESLLERFRLAVTPTLGESPEQRLERQMEAEKLRGLAYQSIGAGRYVQTPGGFVPAFDVRRARRLQGILGGIEQQAALRGPASGDQSAEALRQLVASGVGQQNVFHLNVSDSGSIFTDPRARARLFQEFTAFLDTLARRSNPAMSGY